MGCSRDVVGVLGVLYPSHSGCRGAHKLQMGAGQSGEVRRPTRRAHTYSGIDVRSEARGGWGGVAGCIYRWKFCVCGLLVVMQSISGLMALVSHLVHVRNGTLEDAGQTSAYWINFAGSLFGCGVARATPDAKLSRLRCAYVAHMAATFLSVLIIAWVKPLETMVCAWATWKPGVCSF